jgi:hypothetical protein
VQRFETDAFRRRWRRRGRFDEPGRIDLAIELKSNFVKHSFNVPAGHDRSAGCMHGAVEGPQEHFAS